RDGQSVQDVTRSLPLSVLTSICARALAANRQPNLSCEAASRINHAVIDRSRARRHEALMKLVAERVSHHEQERNPKPARAQQLLGRSAERARRQQRQDRVLGKMSGLAKHEMNCS